MKVLLKHGKNPDVRGGYWSAIDRPKQKWVEVNSFGEASQVCRDYIDQYELGGGNWHGGQVVDGAGKQIARVSYNGRVWDNNDNEIV